MLGQGTYCGNTGIGNSTIATMAAAYYFTAINAWKVIMIESSRDIPDKQKGCLSVEFAHGLVALTNMAFACELAFKSLLSEKDREHIHKFKQLYDKFPPDLQYRLRF